MKLRENLLSTEKLIFLTIGGVTVLVLIFIVIFSINEQKGATGKSNTNFYSVSDRERPKVNIDSYFADLGTMKVKDEKSVQFTIENIGAKPLQLFKIRSSCDCTFGQLTIDGVKSPEFGMHSQSLWVGTVEAGKKATLFVIYRPSIMPIKGAVTRDVYVQTNDPEKPSLTFTVKAFVE